MALEFRKTYSVAGRTDDDVMLLAMLELQTRAGFTTDPPTQWDVRLTALSCEYQKMGVMMVGYRPNWWRYQHRGGLWA